MGVQRYEQPSTLLLLDTGAEVCVACIDSTHGQFSVQMLDEHGEPQQYDKVFFINPPGDSSMFKRMALLGQSFLPAAAGRGAGSGCGRSSGSRDSKRVRALLTTYHLMKMQTI